MTSSLTETATPSTTVVRFCLTCGVDRNVNAETFVCLACGKPTARGDVPDRLRAEQSLKAASAQLATPTQAKRLELPRSAATARWVQQTRALAENFGRLAEDARQRAKQATAEADDYARAAAAFSSLLNQVDASADAPAAASRTPRLVGGSKRWARDYDACVVCGTTERPHAAKGRCRRCDDAHRKGAVA